ncbi:hypothetical protein KKG83_06800 [Candidatus Micrarchaeota archaeon]|nr:hypothetical protein [Candidatus Micrarchaeota archaeon]MBU2477152.1 hypothetical protein [Candidatus Micrarchaeota archaeon]
MKKKTPRKAPSNKKKPRRVFHPEPDAVVKAELRHADNLARKFYKTNRNIDPTLTEKDFMSVAREALVNASRSPIIKNSNIKKVVTTSVLNALRNYLILLKAKKRNAKTVSLEMIAEIPANRRFNATNPGIESIIKIIEKTDASKLNKRLLIEHEVFGHKYRELAEIYNIPEGSVKSAIYQIKKKLRENREMQSHWAEWR